MAAPYDDVILDHIRNARNYRVPAAANRQVAGSNPLCGDELVLYLELDATVRFPSRARCVALPWSTLQSALSRTGQSES